MTSVEYAMEELKQHVKLWEKFEKAQSTDIEDGIRNRFVEEFIVPRVTKVFRAKFQRIQKWHDIEDCEGRQKFVVHYTSLGTLFSVLRNYDEKNPTYLRMYDSFHLNDPEEGIYLTGNPNLGIDPPEVKFPHAYIASFVIYDEKDDVEFGDEDNLTYWLAYGSRGKGCSIKIPVTSNRFQRVLYGKSMVERTLLELDVPSILKCLKPLSHNHTDATRLITEAVWASLEQIRYLYKGDAYKYEKECRLVKSAIDIAHKGEVHFEPEELRDSSHRVRHYYEDETLMIGNLLVTGSCITFGPLVSNTGSLTYYVQNLLDDAGLKGTKIKPSKVPYQES